jgi:dienelactone hydrolase
MELPGPAQRVHERTQRIERHIELCYGYTMHALLLAAALTATSVQFPSLDYGLTIPAMLYEPAVTPAPAVLVLPCAGLDQQATDWAQWLAQNGYIALVPDSFAARSVDRTCGATGVTAATRALDAYGALSYLRTRPDVDLSHVGEIGLAQAGDTVLYTEDHLSAHPAFAASVTLCAAACAAPAASAPAFPLLPLTLGASDVRTRVLAFFKQYL